MHVVSLAEIIPEEVNTDGAREILGVATGASEAETFWCVLRRSLIRCGLCGVKPANSDANEGLIAAASKVLNFTWQRLLCPLDPQRPGPRRRGVAPNGAGNDHYDLCEGEAGLTFICFARAHRTYIHRMDPLERMNPEFKHRTNVARISANDRAIVRLADAMMLEQNDEWSL